MYFGEHGGWVSARYINDGTKVIKAQIKAVPKTSGIVTANVLNVRSQANVSSAIVGKLKKGDIVKIGLIYKDRLAYTLGIMVVGFQWILLNKEFTIVTLK